MLSKCLIQFFVDGWSCLPSLLFIWGQTMHKCSLFSTSNQHLLFVCFFDSSDSDRCEVIAHCSCIDLHFPDD